MTDQFELSKELKSRQIKASLHNQYKPTTTNTELAHLYNGMVVSGLLDFRYLEDVSKVSSFMFSHGEEIYKDNVFLYALLLGFLIQAKSWFPREKIYSNTDLNQSGRKEESPN